MEEKGKISRDTEIHKRVLSWWNDIGRKAIMTNFEWLKKYKAKLGRAWSNGCDDRLAAVHAGITERELTEKLLEIPELREYRDKKADPILIKSYENIAGAIREGDTSLSKWYIDHMEKRYGDREVSVEPEDDGVDDFLDNFTAKGEFDEQ